MNKTERAALVVFLVLLGAAITGGWLYFAYADEQAVPFLAACTLVAACLVVATVYVLVRLNRSRRLADEHGVPQSKVLLFLSHRQWLTMMVGLTVIAIAVASLTGVKVLSRADPVAGPEPVASQTRQALPTAAQTTEAGEPSPTPEPSDSPSGSVEPSIDPSLTPTPRPGSTTYLDDERVLAGSYDPRPATFSGQRHSHGIAFDCQTITSTYLQWNVAGSTSFKAVAGIDDETRNAFGVTVELIFYDQDGHQLGKAINASVGHPQDVSLDLTGVVSLRMTCAGRDTKTNHQYSTRAALGDPLIVHG